MPSTPPEAEPPLLAGVVHGVRVWGIGPGLLLHGAGNGASHAWSPDGEPTSAHCLAETHRAPDPGCGCGLYGYHPHSFTRRPLRRTSLGEVTGVIEAWGRLELHGAGFRARYARPLALFFPPEHLIGLGGRERIETLAARYEVPAVELPGPAMAAEWCRVHGFGLDCGVISRLLGAREAAAGKVGCE